MNKSSSTPHIIDTSKVADMQSTFAKKHPTWCPYHAFIGHLNNVTALTSGDKLLPVRKVIKEIYALWGDALSHVIQTVNKYLPESLCIKSINKTTKHIYDVLFLEQEVYPLLHGVLVEDQRKYFSDLYPRSSRAPVEDIKVRAEAGEIITEHFLDAIAVVLKEWFKKKLPPSNDLIHAANLAWEHSSVTRWGGPASFSTMFFQGASDGFHSLWAIIYYLPELFYKKHNRLPTRQEYRQVVQQNIDKVLIPISSLHLISLLAWLRDQTIDINTIWAVDSLSINITTHALDDNNIIIMDRKYLWEVLHRMDEEIEDLQLYSLLPPSLRWFQLRTWCPALTARAPDGKRVIEHFLEDCMALFDKVYFSHWKE